MPIDVVCTGCKTRFKVADEHAGKKGPCPKCKVVITIPDKPAVEVKIHAPEVSGPKDSKGQQVIQPIKRRNIRFSPVTLSIVLGTLAVALIGAAVLRVTYKTDPGKPIAGKQVTALANVPLYWLAIGACVIAPPLCWGGYQVLRDQELDAYRGRELLIRVLVCAVAYAALWGVYFGVKATVLEGKPPESFMMLVVVPPFVFVGGAVGFGCFGLNYGTGVLHYGAFLLVSVLLRLVANVGPL